jgi:hypothetical protein
MTTFRAVEFILFVACGTLLLFNASRFPPHALWLRNIAIVVGILMIILPVIDGTLRAFKVAG